MSSKTRTVSLAEMGLREGQEPILEERKLGGFLREKDFTVKNRSKRLDLTSEIEVLIKRRNGNDLDANQEFCEIEAEICTKVGRKCIGYFTGKVFRLIEYPYSPMEIFNAFDAIDQDSCDFASDVVIENAVDMEEFCEGQNFVIADRIEILPEWVGRGIGMAALKAILHYISRIDNVSVCFLKPFPLQFKVETPQRSPDPALLREYEIQFRKLLSYYERNLGIKRVAPKSDFYFFRFSE